MAEDPAERLRLLLGEQVPEGGTDKDTLFTDSQIEQLLLETGNNLDRAAYEGWRIKAAHFANLVNVVDGNAVREMSDLYKNAESMIRVYLRSASGPTEGRTRVGKIVRAT
jgi:hypothetical protein